MKNADFEAKTLLREWRPVAAFVFGTALLVLCCTDNEQRAAKAEAELAALKGQTCRWLEDDDGNWDTACGDKFVFCVDGPVENHLHFCCYCGKRLVSVAWARREP